MHYMGWFLFCKEFELHFFLYEKRFLNKVRFDLLIAFFMRASSSWPFTTSSNAGVYRAVPMRVNPRQSNVKSVYKTHIDVIHFRKTDEKRLHGLDEEAEQKLFTEDRVQTLKELAAKPDVYERLSSALAPSIYEHEDIKKVGI